MFIRIPEFPDYAVNENGEVYSFLSNKFLAPGQNTAGYLQVNLMRDGSPINVRVHRLVAYCFGLLPELESELVVDHINDDKLDPRLVNLQVLTYKANAIKFHNKNWREHPDFLAEVKKLESMGITKAASSYRRRAMFKYNVVIPSGNTLTLELIESTYQKTNSWRKTARVLGFKSAPAILYRYNKLKAASL